MKKLLSIVNGESTKTNSASAAGDMKKFMSIINGTVTKEVTEQKTVVKESAINSYFEQVQEDRTETASLKKQIVDEAISEKAKKVADKLKEKYGLSEAKKPSEGNDDDVWGPQGRFAGDVPVDLGGAVSKRLDVGDVVSYFGEKATIQAMSKDRTVSRIDLKSGITQNVKTSDLKRVGQGMAKKKVSESLNEEGMQQLMPKIAQAKELLAKMPESQSKAKAQEHIAAAEENINAGNSFKALYHIAQFSRYAGTTESRVIESINVEAMKHYLSRLDERVSIGPDGKITGGIKPSKTNPAEVEPGSPTGDSAEVTPIKPTQSTVEKYTPGVTYPGAYTISYNGKEYKFAGRDKVGPGTGEKIVVGAGAIGIRGLAPTTIELGNDGMYYHAGL